MVLPTLAFLEDVTDREGFPDNELVSQNLGFCKKMNLTVTYCILARLQHRFWVCFFFFSYRFALGNDKVFSVLNILFVSPNGCPWLLPIQLMQCDSELLGKEKELGWWHTYHLPLLSAIPLLQAHFHFWDWHDTKNSLSWLQQAHSNAYLLIATPTVVVLLLVKDLSLVRIHSHLDIVFRRKH